MATTLWYASTFGELLEDGPANSKAISMRMITYILVLATRLAVDMLAALLRCVGTRYRHG